MPGPSSIKSSACRFMFPPREDTLAIFQVERFFLEHTVAPVQGRVDAFAGSHVQIYICIYIYLYIYI